MSVQDSILWPAVYLAVTSCVSSFLHNSQLISQILCQSNSICFFHIQGKLPAIYYVKIGQTQARIQTSTKHFPSNTVLLL